MIFLIRKLVRLFKSRACTLAEPPRPGGSRTGISVRAGKPTSEPS